jgi:tRNA U55 pseudouridine synthase TruB
MPAVEREARLLPLDALLQDLPQVRLEPAQQARFLQGQALPWVGPSRARVRVYGGGGALLGVGEAGADGTLSPKRVIAQV